MDLAGKIRKKVLSRQTKRNLFFISCAALPLVQFLIFYVYVNFESISMAFTHYSVKSAIGGGYIKTFTLENFSLAWEYIVDRPYLIENSMKLFFVRILISLPLALLFSNYIYKRWFGSGFFKTILFLPQLISTLVYGIIFVALANDGYQEITGDEFGLLSLDRGNTSLASFTIILFNVLMGFGVNVLLFSGSMSNINTSIVESAQLDGVNSIQEFIYITFPSIFETFIQLFIIFIANIFVDQMGLLVLEPNGARELSTIGYSLYFMAKDSGLVPEQIVAGTPELLYPALSALGLMITIVVAPITIITRKLLYKFGPKEK